MTHRDCRTDGRVILALGEATGHCHEVLVAVTGLPPDMAEAQFFETDAGRELVVLVPCELRHQEHGPIALDPAHQIQARQGDVLLHPTGPGTWRVLTQQEYEPEGWRAVQD